MNRRLRRNWPHLLLLLAGLTLLWFTLRAVTFAEIRVVLRELSALDLAVLAVVNVLALVLFTGRWWLFLVAQGYSLPYFKLVGYRLAAFGVSYFTPGPHFGGEPLQVYLVTRRHGVPTDASIAAVTMDKLLDLLTNFIFLAGGLLFVLQQQVLPAGVGGTAVQYALLLVLAPLALLMALWLDGHPLSAPLRWLLRVWPNPLLARGHAVLVRSETLVSRLCRQQPAILLAALIVSGLSWVAIIGEYWLMTRLLGLDLSMGQAVLALVAARIAILLPMPAGLGTLEASQVIAMGLLGQPAAAGATIGLLIRARDVILGLIGLWIGGAELWSTTVSTPGETSHAPHLPDEQPDPVVPAAP